MPSGCEVCPKCGQETLQPYPAANRASCLRVTDCGYSERREPDLQRRLQQAQEERDRLKVPVPDDPNPCPRCGRQSGLCASVSNKDWLRITGHRNGGGHLCLWCMDDLAVEKGLSGVHCTLTFAGRAIWSDDDPIEEACQARAERDAAIERGCDLWRFAVMALDQWDMWEEGFGLEMAETTKAIKRAEAVEHLLEQERADRPELIRDLQTAREDAAEQRALAERKQYGLDAVQQWYAEREGRDCPFCGQDIPDHSPSCLLIVVGKAREAKVPAEAQEESGG